MSLLCPHNYTCDQLRWVKRYSQPIRGQVRVKLTNKKPVDDPVIGFPQIVTRQCPRTSCAARARHSQPLLALSLSLSPLMNKASVLVLTVARWVENWSRMFSGVKGGGKQILQWYIIINVIFKPLPHTNQPEISHTISIWEKINTNFLKTS